jgi:anti-sigma-K factor RskA
MTAHDWFIEHRTEYAAGALEPGEMARLAEHLERCVECRAAVHRIESDVRWLPMAVAPVTPRPGLQREILRHATRRAGSGLSRWRLPVGIAAALFSGLIGWQLGQRNVQHGVSPAVALTPSGPLSSGSLPTPTLATRFAALQDTVSIMRQAAKVMQATIMMHGKEGGMVIFADASTHRWNVVVHGLPQAPADGRYQFWFVCSDGMVRGAAVNVNPTTPVVFTTGMPVQPCNVMGAALTIEPMQETDGPPRGKELAHVLL